MTTADPRAGFYRRISDSRYEPTEHTQGAWRATEQHMGPVSGLLAHALQTRHRRDDLQLCRISYEILGVISKEPFEIEVEVVRPGRTIELVEARMIINGRPAVRATGWRLATSDTAAVAGGAPEPMPGPQDWPVWDVDGFWSGGYIDSLDFHVDPASVPGRSRAWLRARVDLVEGEQADDLATFTALVDTANGIAARKHPRTWAFPNIDLTIHYYRPPAFTDPDRRWVGLDSTAIWGSAGIGLTTTTLYDPSGPVGRAEQILTLRRLEPGG